jgi:hypothetical protein
MGRGCELPFSEERHTPCVFLVRIPVRWPSCMVDCTLFVFSTNRHIA